MHNLNDYRPDKVFARNLRDNLLTFKDTIFASDKQLDSIAVWLVGMSTGSIALIISQFGKLNPKLYIYLKMGILFLTATIIFGLVFRILHFFLREHNRDVQMYINGWLTSYSEPSLEAPFKLPDDASAQFIAFCYYKQMGVDMPPELLEHLENNDDDIDHWRNKYAECSASRLALIEEEDKAVANMIEQFYERYVNLEGLPPHTFEQATQNYNNKSSGIRKRRLKQSCNIFYILMCISFAVAVLFISCSFIITDYKANNTSTTTTTQQSSPSEQVQPNQINKTD